MSKTPSNRSAGYMPEIKMKIFVALLNSKIPQFRAILCVIIFFAFLSMSF